ncbi:MAG: hypothetical protein MI807_07380 [Verrucomicrobiales bacterium]|nr:hypothetical protein [Verrucomicrobiales bacterium]
MEHRPIIILAIAVIAVFGIGSFLMTSSGSLPENLFGKGDSTNESATPAEPVELLTETGRYSVSERTEEGIHVLPHLTPILDGMHSEESDPIDDLHSVEELITFYLKSFRSIPPGGENVDIVRAMTGTNERKLALIPPGHRVLNEQNEIVDRWQTAFHFHPVSSSILEVRSAGPDRKLWTDDDLVIGQGESDS